MSRTTYVRYGWNSRLDSGSPVNDFRISDRSDIERCKLKKYQVRCKWILHNQKVVKEKAQAGEAGDEVHGGDQQSCQFSRRTSALNPILRPGARINARPFSASRGIGFLPISTESDIFYLINWTLGGNFGWIRSSMPTQTIHGGSDL